VSISMCIIKLKVMAIYLYLYAIVVASIVAIEAVLSYHDLKDN